jgi:hypothetical protein
MWHIRGQKDFGIGAIYLGLGLAGLVIARDYTFGTAGRMGPGYFPTIISGLLILFGLVTLSRGLLRDGERVADVNWKGAALITLSVCAFGFLLEGAGLVIALVALVLISAAASDRFRFELRAMLGLVALVIFCIAVFVYGLGLPMPILGDWLRS